MYPDVLDICFFLNFDELASEKLMFDFSVGLSQIVYPAELSNLSEWSDSLISFGYNVIVKQFIGQAICFLYGYTNANHIYGS